MNYVRLNRRTLTKPIFEIMKIFRVEKSVVTEHKVETLLAEKFFDSLSKAYKWINDCMESESEYADGEVIDYCCKAEGVYCIAKQFFGDGGYHHYYIVTSVEVA